MSNVGSSGQLDQKPGVIPLQEEQSTPQKTQKKPDSSFQRAVKWIAKKVEAKGPSIIQNNTYIPGISTVTGVCKIGIGLLVGGYGFAKAVAGGVVFLTAKVVHHDYSAEIQKNTNSWLNDGIACLATGVKEMARGAVSSVPVLGNFVVYRYDRKKAGIHDPVERMIDKDKENFPKWIQLAAKNLKDPSAKGT